MGGTHTADIPFVLGNTVNLLAPNGDCDMTHDEKELSAFMNKARTFMAENQRPTSNAARWPTNGDAQKSLGVNIVESAGLCRLHCI